MEYTKRMSFLQKGMQGNFFKWIGFFFLAQAGMVILTDYAVLEEINQELNVDCEKLNKVLLEDYEKTLKKIKNN